MQKAFLPGKKEKKVYFCQYFCLAKRVFAMLKVFMMEKSIFARKYFCQDGFPW
jgi:hypothetical protein